MRPPSHVAHAAAAAITLLAMMLSGCSGQSPSDSRRERVQSQQDLAARYLYVVDCIGRVDKIDTLQQELAASHVLTEPMALPSAPWVALPLIEGGRDGCLTQSPLINADGTELSLIASKGARTDADGMMDYQILTFRLPQWTLVAAKHWGRADDNRLQLVRDGDGALRVLADPPQTTAGRSYAFGAGGNAIWGKWVQRSAGVSLIALSGPRRDEFLLGLAKVDGDAGGLVRIANDLYTDPRFVHLAPGGTFVLVEEVTPSDNRPLRTGRLRLYDSTGAMAGELHDDTLPGSTWGEMTFVTITPNGYAVYVDRYSGAYRFVPLGRTFANEPVEVPQFAPGYGVPSPDHVLASQ
ncbi:MAG: hypothetical protein LC098_00445 [Burkholderiales bacterium]|nr:hypothetical protein [Burkholderiales bacterium]